MAMTVAPGAGRDYPFKVLDGDGVDVAKFFWKTDAELFAIAEELAGALRLCHTQMQRHDGESAGWREADEAANRVLAKVPA